MTQRILRPMEYGDIFDEMFDLYKRHFLLFIGIIALSYVPGAILTSATLAWFFRSRLGDLINMATSNTQPSQDEMGRILSGFLPLIPAVLLVWLVFVICSLIASAAITWATSKCYLGSKPTILESYKAVLPKTFSLIVTGIIMGVAMLIVGIPSACCIGIPALMVYAFFAFIPQATVIEGKLYGEALVRSWNLGSRDWVRTFVVLLIAFVLNAVVSQIAGLPMRFAQFSGSDSTWALVLIGIGALGTLLASIAIVPLQLIALVLVYYDIRVRREGFDLELLAQNMGESMPASPEGADTGHHQ